MPSRPLTDTEITRIITTLHRPRDVCLFVLGLKTGFRISELLSITIDECIQYGTMRDSITVNRADMKGKRVSRTVPLHAQAKTYLTEYIKSLDSALGCTKLFPISRIQAHRILRDAVIEARVGGKVSCHSMRKTFGMGVYKRSGKDIVATQKALGHVSLSSTTHYLSVDADTVDAAILGG